MQCYKNCLYKYIYIRYFYYIHTIKIVQYIKLLCMNIINLALRWTINISRKTTVNVLLPFNDSLSNPSFCHNFSLVSNPSLKTIYYYCLNVWVDDFFMSFDFRKNKNCTKCQVILSNDHWNNGLSVLAEGLWLHAREDLKFDSQIRRKIFWPLPW